MVSEEFLDLRAHVWGIRAYIPFRDGHPTYSFFLDQDLHKLSKQDSTEVRI